MFTDPQSVTISGTLHTLQKVSQDGMSSLYQKDDGSVKLSVTHRIGKRIQRVASIVHSKFAADPLFPAQNVPYSLTCKLVVDVPPVGYTVAEAKAVVDGFLASLQASSGASITKLLGGES